MLWGDDAKVRERLAPYFHDVETELVAIDFDKRQVRSQLLLHEDVAVFDFRREEAH